MTTPAPAAPATPNPFMPQEASRWDDPFVQLGFALAAASANPNANLMSMLGEAGLSVGQQQSRAKQQRLQQALMAGQLEDTQARTQERTERNAANRELARVLGGLPPEQGAPSPLSLSPRDLQILSLAPMIEASQNPAHIRALNEARQRAQVIEEAETILQSSPNLPASVQRQIIANPRAAGRIVEAHEREMDRRANRIPREPVETWQLMTPAQRQQHGVPDSAGPAYISSRNRIEVPLAGKTPESQETKLRAETSEKMFAETFETAGKAATSLAALQRQQSALDAGFRPGATAELRNQAARALEGIGVGSGFANSLFNADMARFRQFQANSELLVTEVAKMLGANPTDSDARRIAATVAQTSDPREAAQLLIRDAMATQRNRVQAAIDMANDMGRANDPAFRRRVQNWSSLLAPAEPAQQPARQPAQRGAPAGGNPTAGRGDVSPVPGPSNIPPPPNGFRVIQ